MARRKYRHTTDGTQARGNAEGSLNTTSMEMIVRWKDGREEQACAIVPTIGLGIGDLVSKVMVRRDGHPEFYPLYMAEYVEIRSYGEIHRIRESQPVTVNMLQR